MKITYEKLFQFNAIAGAYLQKEQDTKLKYAINKVAKRLTKAFENYNEMVADIKRDHCYTEKDIIVRDEKGEYKYTKENEKKMTKAVKDLINNEIEFEPYFVLNIPEGLTEIEIESFEGIVLSPEHATELKKGFE